MKRKRIAAKMKRSNRTTKDASIKKTKKTLQGDKTELGRIEKKAQFERRRLFSILDELPVVIAIIAQDHSIRFSNRQLRELFGDPEGRFCYEVLHNSKEPCASCPSFRVFDTGEPQKWESKRSDGRTYMTYDYPFNDVDGSLLVLEASFDITERKQVEEAMRDSESRYSTLFQESPISLWEQDYSRVKAFIDKLRNSGVKDFREYFEGHPEDVSHCVDMITVIDLNKATLDLYQARSKDELRNNLKSVFGKETYDALREELITIAEGKTKFQMEIVTQTVNGDKINVDFRSHAAPGHEKTYSKMLLSMVDVTKLKQIENELKRHSEHLEELVQERTRDLRENEAKLRSSSLYVRSLIEASLDPLVTISPDGKITDVNKATELVTEISRDQLIGSDFSDYFTDPEKAKEGYEEVFAKGFVKDCSLAIRGKSGKVTDVLYNATVYRDEMEKVQGVFAAARDVTERKRMEEKLRGAERFAGIGEAAAMVGHDLRNPLQVIINRLYLAKKATECLSFPYSEIAEKLGLKEFFNELTNQTEYMNKIVSDLQDYARPLKPELVETNVRQLIESAFSLINVPANIEVSTGAVGAVKVAVDPEFMRRVFTNLILNAFQAMPGGGKLVIRTSETGEVVFISFQDTGVGILKENIDRLFTPLYTTKAKGAGLGLPVCKRLVEAHNGRIMIESQVGKGSTFTVRLPILRGSSSKRILGSETVASSNAN